MKQSTDSHRDTVCMTMASTDLEMRDDDSLSSASSKDGSVDVNHFAEVVVLKSTRVSLKTAARKAKRDTMNCMNFKIQ